MKTYHADEEACGVTTWGLRSTAAMAPRGSPEGVIFHVRVEFTVAEHQPLISHTETLATSELPLPQLWKVQDSPLSSTDLLKR